MDSPDIERIIKLHLFSPFDCEITTDSCDDTKGDAGEWSDKSGSRCDDDETRDRSREESNECWLLLSEPNDEEPRKSSDRCCDICIEEGERGDAICLEL